MRAELVLVATVAAASNTNQNTSPQSHLAALRDIAVSCSPSGTIKDACCEYKTIEQLNNDISPYLRKLVKTSFFRYVKINLERGCQFWKEDLLCHQEGCSVELADENELPLSLQTTNHLSKIDYTLTDNAVFPFFNKDCEFQPGDFCDIDDPEKLHHVPYVNLLRNPEKFTGYAGASAARVWGAIYQENCFNVATKGSSSEINTGLDELFKGGVEKIKMTEGNEEEVCLEKRVFYRLVSGLHASISTHICDQYLDSETGDWYQNLDCFKERLGKHPERIQNLYFTYVVLLRAVTKLAPYLENNPWTSSTDDKLRIGKLVKGIVETSLACPPTFDEHSMFTKQETLHLKEEFKNHFRNISLIMDCVGCDKCRLWGKLQVTGLGTALKILFSFSDDPSQYRLKRTELVSLINGFNRLSNSLQAIQMFRTRIKDQERILQEITTKTQGSSTARKISNKAHHSAATIIKSKEEIAADFMSFTDFMEPKKVIKWSVGLVISVVGFVSILYKGWKRNIASASGIVEESEADKEARRVNDESFEQPQKENKDETTSDKKSLRKRK